VRFAHVGARARRFADSQSIEIGPARAFYRQF
jgi:hypothetical protein